VTVKYDLLLKGGTVVDPSQDLNAKRDIAFTDGKVAALAQNLLSEEASEVIDVDEKLVVPGMIDFHGHFSHRIVAHQADPDATCLPIGVTTAVDAGSTGWMNFPGLRSYVIERVETRLFAFIHLSSIGHTPVFIQIPDLEDFRFAREQETSQCIEENRDLILGIKVRLSPSGTTAENAVPAMEMARRIADETETKIMVHVMESPLPLAQVFDYLKPGDIATHILHGDVYNVLDKEGQISPEVWDAYNRGVIFDTASAMRHFSIPVCKAALDQGLLPHTISTDRVGPRVDRANYDLLDHMSIFLELGMKLEDVVKSVTINAASAIGKEDLGTLRVGSAGDAAILEFREGEFRFEDELGNELQTTRRFSPVLTIKNGKLWRKG